MSRAGEPTNTIDGNKALAGEADGRHAASIKPEEANSEEESRAEEALVMIGFLERPTLRIP